MSSMNGSENGKVYSRTLDIILATNAQVNSYWKERSGSVEGLTFLVPSTTCDMPRNVREYYTHSEHQTGL